MIFAALLSGIAIGTTVFFFCRRIGPGGALEEEKNVQRRISPSAPAREKDVARIRKRTNLSDVEILEKTLRHHKKISDHVAFLLNSLRLKMSVSAFLLVCVLFGASAMLFSKFWFSLTLSVAIGLCSAILPYLFLLHRRRRYLAKFSAHLPDALSIVSNSIKVGHGLEAAMDAIAKTAPRPVSDEFGIARAEMRLGVPMHTALENLNNRIGNHELKILITGISIQQELGGNLSEVLDNLEKTIRDRFAVVREISTLSSQGKYSAWILFLVPLVLLSLYVKQNPKLFMQFLHSPQGGFVIWTSLVLDLAGFLWIRQIVKLRD